MADQQTIMHKPEAPCLLIEDRVSVNQNLGSPVLISTVGEYTALTKFAQGPLDSPKCQKPNCAIPVKNFQTAPPAHFVTKSANIGSDNRQRHHATPRIRFQRMSLPRTNLPGSKMSEDISRMHKRTERQSSSNLSPALTVPIPQLERTSTNYVHTQTADLSLKNSTTSCIQKSADSVRSPG
jgi:hypothetical protein